MSKTQVNRGIAVGAKIVIAIAALNGSLAVCLGAFGAHGLKKMLSEQALQVWQTGVTYHFYHVLALLAVGLLMQRKPKQALSISAWLFLAGILMFSGSLYGLALGGPGWLGPVTPLGGISFIVAWLLMGVAALKD